MQGSVRQLGYIGMNATDPAKWAEFGTHLGAEILDLGDGVIGMRMDNDRAARLYIHPAQEDGLAYGGWEVAGPQDLRAIQERLDGLGLESTLDGAAAVSRGVEEVLSFKDPDGNPCEVYWGAGSAIRTQFVSPFGVEFSMGEMGAGHLTYGVKNFRATHDFYTEALGMRLTEIAEVGGGRVGFLRCNPRHHSIAFAELPSGTSRLMHLALEVTEFDSLGSIRDRLFNASFPIARDLGRHPTDGVISLYAGVAAGFDVELGWGSIFVDEESWERDRYDRTGWSWGHREVTSYGTSSALGETEIQR